MSHCDPQNTDNKFKFERHGCFVANRVDHLSARQVSNLAIALKDSWDK